MSKTFERVVKVVASTTVGEIGVLSVPMWPDALLDMARPDTHGTTIVGAM
jgi:hypothetical protein